MWGSRMMMKGYGFDFDFVMMIRESVDKFSKAKRCEESNVQI